MARSEDSFRPGRTLDDDDDRLDLEAVVDDVEISRKCSSTCFTKFILRIKDLCCVNTYDLGLPLSFLVHVLVRLDYLLCLGSLSKKYSSVRSFT
jgi:hypothetical protein